MDVCLVSVVLSGRGHCDEVMTRPEESYSLWCVVVCDLETSWNIRPWPTGGLLRQKQSNLLLWLATGRTVWESNPDGGEIFRTRPDRHWGPPSLLYNGRRLSFAGLKRPGRGVDHPPSSSAVIKEGIELYSPSGPSWPLLERTLSFTFHLLLSSRCDRLGRV